MTKVVFILTFFISFSSLACSLEGKFSNIVFDIFGKDFANTQTSYGLSLIDAHSGEVLCEDYVQPDRFIYPASTVKTLIAVAVLKMVQDKKLSLDDSVTINQVNAAAECKYWNCDFYGPGKSRKIRELLWDMITISNNLATNQLIDVASKTFINQTATELNVAIQINRKVYDDVNPEPDITIRNQATSRGLVKLYEEISTGRLNYLREDLRILLVDILGHQKYNGSLNKNFPENVKFYHKTGNTSAATGDGGFFYLNENVIAVLVGLQDFNRYRVCHGSDCFYRNGFWSLSEIGHRTFHLVQDL